MLNRLVRRWLLPALAVLLCIASSYAPSVAAGPTTTHWVFETLKFRNHNTTFATQSGAFNDAGTLDAFDSTYASGIAKFDTTTAIATDGWSLANTAGSLDSVTVARLYIYDAGLSTVTLGKTSATAESIYIKTQVSPNGKTWFDCAVIPGQSPVLNALTVQTTANAGVLTFTASQNTGSSDKMWTLRYVKAPMAAARKDAIDINHIAEFPLVRWIIYGSRTLNHSYNAAIAHWTTTTNQ